MLATAIVKYNNLIIPNIDLSNIHNQIDDFGRVKIELNFLGKAKKYTLAELLAQTDYDSVHKVSERETNTWLNAPAVGRELL